VTPYFVVLWLRREYPLWVKTEVTQRQWHVGYYLNSGHGVRRTIVMETTSLLYRQKLASKHKAAMSAKCHHATLGTAPK
jgi:hypothetical protein